MRKKLATDPVGMIVWSTFFWASFRQRRSSRNQCTNVLVIQATSREGDRIGVLAAAETIVMHLEFIEKCFN